VRKLPEVMQFGEAPPVMGGPNLARNLQKESACVKEGRSGGCEVREIAREDVDREKKMERGKRAFARGGQGSTTLRGARERL